MTADSTPIDDQVHVVRRAGATECLAAFAGCEPRFSDR